MDIETVRRGDDLPDQGYHLGTAYWSPGPDGMANARLMAAAPDLLEVYRALVAWRESPRSLLDDLRRVTDHASAAIMRAEGSHP